MKTFFDIDFVITGGTRLTMRKIVDLSCPPYVGMEIEIVPQDTRKIESIELNTADTDIHAVIEPHEVDSEQEMKHLIEEYEFFGWTRAE